ncbi:MAG: nitroreductase [Clostridiales Family XIII bacterium]|jgi:nitroreductase|nr:nitroreductase [Clostridiales Family XIII bacterium]
MTLYETIFTRRSVRQYEKEPLDAVALSEIEKYLEDAPQLAGQTAQFEIASADKLKGVAAPHAILAYSDDSDAALTNIGYVLQGVDLYLQSKGLGSLWMGQGKPVERKPDYRILLAFGKTSVPPRSSENDFKRKAVLETSNEDNAVARAARLAPSAANFQPWKLHFAPGKVSVQYNGKGIGKLFASKMQKIDLGIILKTVELALEHEGKTVQSITPKTSEQRFAIEPDLTAMH